MIIERTDAVRRHHQDVVATHRIVVLPRARGREVSWEGVDGVHYAIISTTSSTIAVSHPVRHVSFQNMQHKIISKRDARSLGYVYAYVDTSVEPAQIFALARAQVIVVLCNLSPCLTTPGQVTDRNSR